MPDLRFEASRRARRGKKLRSTVRLLALVVTVVFALFPVVWIVSASLDATNSLLDQKLVPRNPSMTNYNQLFNNPTHPFGRWLLNSFKIAGTTAVLSVLMTAMAAYSFSRFRFTGRRSLFLTVLLIQIFPNILAMAAIFILVQQLGNYVPFLGLNNHGSLILVYLGGVLGFNMFLMKGYFDSIPRALDEAARIDGATNFQVFTRIIFPLVRPIVAVVAILTFIGTYSDFILARILLSSTEQFTLAVGLSLFISGQFTQQWGVFAAGALIGAFPIVIVFIALQDYLVGGLTMGGVKG